MQGGLCEKPCYYGVCERLSLRRVTMTMAMTRDHVMLLCWVSVNVTCTIVNLDTL